MTNLTPKTSRISPSKRFFNFLGSMEFAITLLITLSIASVIGTVLQQNQPYTDYVIKFGPFWFEVFEALGLYSVYSALWFLFILTVLVVSTGICLIRHFPSMSREIWQLRTNVQKKSLRMMQHSAQWHEEASSQSLVEKYQQHLKQQGFRSRVTDKKDGTLVSAMRGGMNRLGYIFTHLAIVIICIGGLIDSNLSIRLAEWRGDLVIETRDLAIRDIPEKSRLPVGNTAFRGTISIPEGRGAEVVFLPVRDGYVVQALPFRIEVVEFRVEHHFTGEPRSFESDLIIHDPELDEPFPYTISVNHPLIHKGYAIYQASFGDGGSELTVEAWPLDSRAGTKPISISTKVFESTEMRWGEQVTQVEMSNFRPFNINPDPTEDDPRNLSNFGPSIGFKLRSVTGEALEYENYMMPVKRDGRYFFLSGVRSTPADEFAYLYLPADDNHELEKFIQFSAALNNSDVRERTAKAMMQESLAMMATRDESLETSLQNTLETLLKMFVNGGYDEVRNFIEGQLPDSERESLGSAYLGMLREMLARIYFTEIATVEDLSNPEEVQFMQDAVDAVGTLPRYGSPVFFKLADFNHIESTGLQIARSPGKGTVYFGCLLLVVGIFLLFYLPQRRLWLWLEPSTNHQTEVILAGTTNRNPRDFDDFFEQQKNLLIPKAGNSDAS